MKPTLPTAGRFIVDTLSDEFDVDLDARIAVRAGLDPDSNDPHPHRREVFLFDTVEVADGFLLFDAEGAPRAYGYVIGVTPHEAVPA